MIRRLTLLLTLLLAGPAAAQLGSGPNMIRPELVVEHAARPGQPVDLAIVMHTTPGWHGYWQNPGDAGLPMQVQWTLPPGWSVAALRYPVPSKLLVADIVNDVFQIDYAVLTRLTVPAGASGGTIAASLHYLACTDEVCVPQSAQVSLNLASAGGASDPRFDGWRQALPRPLASPARWQVRGNRIEIGIPLPASVAVPTPYLFPATDGPIDYGAVQGFRRAGDMLIASLAPRRPATGAIDGVLADGSGRGFAFHAVPGAVPAGGEAMGERAGVSLNAIWAALLGALVGGMLLNLMPCVFPVLALKALHLARGGASEGEARREALAYAAGSVAGTAGLGGLLLAIRAGGSAAGWAFQLQDPRTILLLLLLTAAIAMNLARLFELPTLGGSARTGGGFATGLLAAFIATPCAGPFLGVALGTALLLPAWGGMLVFALLGFGLALPFIAIAFMPALRNRLPRPGAWMSKLQRILAVPMALTALACLWLLWRQAGQGGLLVGLAAVALLGALLWWIGRRQHRGLVVGLAPLGGLALIAIAAALVLPRAGVAGSRACAIDAWSEPKVAAALAAGHPVLVDFTADWCLSCKVNQVAAIDRDEVRAAFKARGVTVLTGDWTDGDPAITRFLEAHGRAGVPYYLWLAPGKPPEELPQVLTPGMLITRATTR